MKIKQYIVTYNNRKVLDACLESMIPAFETSSKDEFEVFIINNHSNFSMDEKFKDCVTVLHNDVRPDFSKGHLSRNWNQAIINGFVNLNNPDCDIVITNQNDTVFHPNYLDEVIELHKTYDLVQLGAGDSFLSYTPNSIKKVGLWDERFSNIGYQEADYFLRALLYLGEKCTINDHHHSRVFNPLQKNDVIVGGVINGFNRGEISHMESLPYHPIQHYLYKHKWHSVGEDDMSTTLYWNDLDKLKSARVKVPAYFYYPYFEKDMDNDSLLQQNYIGWMTIKHL